MPKRGLLFIGILLMAACTASNSGKMHLPSSEPIQLHPENPHYFLYKGKSLALVSSAEHYGSVLNLDFDFDRYLKTLAEDGMNYTRIFTGTYFEIHGQSFNIQNNTLAPLPDRVISPWMKVESADGKQRYDLSKWNEAYFRRLKEFVSEAASYDIIVEITLFSSIYTEDHWAICPQNPANNLNISHPLSIYNAQTLNNGELFAYQEAFVRKIVEEMNEFDNFFYEIQNEPWSDHAGAVYDIINKEDSDLSDWTFKAILADDLALAWQEKLAWIIADQESTMNKKHLIAQNFTNFKASIPSVSEHISILNFHYAWPEAVVWNHHYNKVVGFDESGFAGSGDQVYRRQAWQFMLSGGGLFNSLDYSFYVSHEDGLGENSAPGGGSKALRAQLKILSEFLHGFALEKLNPNQEAVIAAPGLIPYVLSDDAQSYALYLRSTGTDKSLLKLNSGPGSFRVQHLNTITGAYLKSNSIDAADGILSIDITIPEGELALKIVRE